MQLRKVNVGNGPYANANMVCYDGANSQIVFMSLISYDSTIKQIKKEINKRNSVYVQQMGTFRTDPKSYEVITHKDPETEYVHAIIYKKDEIKDAGGKEYLNAYIFVEDNDFNLADYTTIVDRKLPDKFLKAVYDKIYAHTPVPIIEEWMDYIAKALINNNSIRELRVFKPDDVNFKVFKMSFRFDTLYQIVSNGLANRSISINETYEVSEEMNGVTGLDSYLNTFTGILADKIQRSFTPKFTPGVDEYSEKLNIIDDYTMYKGIKMYEAQKAVIQAASNNLDKNNTTFIIGEMGVGKTLLGMSTVYVNSKKEGTTNVILCPGHLVEKWKSEIEKYSPLSEAVIVDNFEHFMALEPKINDPRRRKHLFLILSKETAKFGYELRPSVIWSHSKKSYCCPECGKPLFKTEYEGTGRFRTEKKVPLTERDFVKQYAYNRKCENKINVWDKENRVWVEQICGARLWTPLIKEDGTDWIKLSGGQGWIQTRHINTLFAELTAKDKLDRNDSKFLSALSDALSAAQTGEKQAVRAPRKYPVAKYIKKYYKGKIDYLIADEIKDSLIA